MNYFSKNENILKNNPIFTSSPTRNINFIEKSNPIGETLVSFNEDPNICKMFTKISKNFGYNSSRIKIEDIANNYANEQDKKRKNLNLKGSTDNSNSFTNFMNDVSESMEKKSKGLFYRNKTPEFAKFFQNSAKEKNFFRVEKPKVNQEQPLIYSHNTQRCDTLEMNHFSEFSEQKNEDSNKKDIKIETQTEQNNVFVFLKKKLKNLNFFLDILT